MGSLEPQMTQIHTDVQTKCCCEFTVLVEVERFFRALDSLAGSVYGLGVWKVRGSKRIDPQMTQIHTDVQTARCCKLTVLRKGGGCFNGIGLPGRECVEASFLGS